MITVTLRGTESRADAAPRRLGSPGLPSLRSAAMKHTRIVGTIGAMLVLATLGARPADAQLTKAGVVVGLEGDARIQRLGAPSPAPLQFRDDVFVRDRATTGDNSLARFLLGGKAVLTMRERSVVTIIE